MGQWVMLFELYAVCLPPQKKDPNTTAVLLNRLENHSNWGVTQGAEVAHGVTCSHIPLQPPSQPPPLAPGTHQLCPRDVPCLEK